MEGSPLTTEHEKEIAEVILRTRGYSYRAALPEILGVIRKITARDDESRRAAEKMIADYRAIITGLSD